MNQRYLTQFFILLTLAVASTALLTFTVDPFGIYRSSSAASLSRIDQFYHTRSTKPLIIRKRHAKTVVVGSSRTARISPSNMGLPNAYNAAIPGATPTELREVLEYAHYVEPLSSAYIGWDFEAFLSHTPDTRQGFNSELLNSRNFFSDSVHAAIAHKRTLLSFTALEETYRALYSDDIKVKPTYKPDGSWHRNQPKLFGPFGFNMISREKVETLKREQPITMDTSEIEKAITFCQSNEIQCSVFATPVHLFHFEIFRNAELIPLWRKWHRDLVTVNMQVAKTFQRKPLPIWGFNAVIDAVGEPILTPLDLTTPWFIDNFHFRPKFGDLMLRTMIDRTSANSGAVFLTEANVGEYLDTVLELQGEYMKDNRKVTNRIKRNLKI